MFSETVANKYQYIQLTTSNSDVLVESGDPIIVYGLLVSSQGLFFGRSFDVREANNVGIIYRVATSPQMQFWFSFPFQYIADKGVRIVSTGTTGQGDPILHITVLYRVDG